MYVDWSETRRDRAKIYLAGQHDRQLSKNYFEPCKGCYSINKFQTKKSLIMAIYVKTVYSE